MTPQEWSRIQQGIFEGESGGDYGALFGYQNRPGGKFSNIDLTKMTIDEALEFANPSGNYGQFVKGQVGRVATPMGAYQVVGSTLRDAKKGLGLSGQETMSKDMQDQIGRWIYKTQGTGAWEGYKPLSDDQAIASQTLQVLGKSPKGILAPTQTSETETKPMMNQQKPRGLLENIGIQKMQEGAEGEAGQRFYNRDSFKDTAATLAQGFGRMGIMGMEEIADQVAGQRSEAKARNKTVAYLRKANRNDLADAVESGSLGARDAAGIMFAQPKDSRTALMQNYEYARKTGYEGSFNDFLKSGGGGGSVVNVGQKGSDKFAELDAAALADVSKSAMAAGRSLGQIDRLESLLSNVETGAAASLQSLAGSFGIKTEGLGDIQAAEALISALVPQQRAPGSGPMSDADLDLFKLSLPRLINTPGGNTMILQTMRGLAQYDALGGEIVQRYRSKEITQAEAFAQLQARPDPFAQFRQVVGAPEGGAGIGRDEATKLLLGG